LNLLFLSRSVFQYDQYHGYILEGTIELTVAGEVHVLKAHDSYYFDNNKPHRFRNPFDTICKIVSATTPANF